MKGRRKQGNQIEPDRRRARNGEKQMIVGGHRHLRGFEGEAVLLPLRGHAGDGRARRGRPRLIIHYAHRNRNAGAVGLRIERPRVSGMRPHRDAPVAVVLHAGRRGLGGRSHGDFETPGQRGAGAGLVIRRKLHLGVAAGHDCPVTERAPPLRQGAVADQFGVQAAVVRKIDLLGHQAVQHGADLGGGVIDLNGE